MLVKCGFGSQKTVKSTLKRSYFSSLKSLRLLEFSIFFNGDFGSGSET